MIKHYFNQLIILLLITAHIQAQNCISSRANTNFYPNNAKTKLGLAGSIWDFTYKVPEEGTFANDTPELLYAGNIWLGGLDQEDNLHLAAGTYGFVTGHDVDFFTGPINQDGLTDSVSCANFNHHFKVTKDQIDQFKADYSANGVVDANHSYIFRWPARGNPIFSSFYGFELPDQNLAPFVDHNGDGTYNPYDGDHPDIKGDEAIWWVYNDIGNIHAETGGEPVGAEIQIMAYAFNSEIEEISNTTFYDIRIEAKGSTPLNDFYTSFFVDGSIGCFTDDYVGCIPEENLAFTYNSDAVDGISGCNCDAGVNTFCEEIPVVGIKMLHGSHSREALSFGLSGFSYFNHPGIQPSPPIATTDPQNAQEYYNYMQGLWRDATPLTGEGTGYNPNNENAQPVDFAFPSNPATNTDWTMCTEDLEINRDRRMLLRQGPFTFQNGDVISLTYAVLYVPNVVHPCPDISPLIEAGHIAQEWFDDISTSTSEIYSSVNHQVFPNPFSQICTISLLDSHQQIKNIQLFNALGKQVKQFSDINNSTFKIKRNQMQTGIYFYQLKTIEGKLTSGKLIIH